MHTAAFFVAAVVMLLTAAGCRAADPHPPATTPSTLQATAKAVEHEGAWSLEVTFTNPTDHPLAMGRYLSWKVERTDVSPTHVVLESPAQAMTPHFRVLLPPGASRPTTILLSDAASPLPAGSYHVEVRYPVDVLPGLLTSDFVASTATTKPAQP